LTDPVARERRLAFGDVAELYDLARPGYPAELVDEVLEFAHAGRGDRALEVGAGTGKATVLFAERGLELLALEPSAEMAAVLSRNCERRRNVTIERAEFERWEPGTERFQLLFSAQAWHWIKPETRYAHAREALEPGGALAVFWNRVDWQSCPLREELSDAYRRVTPDLGGDAGPGPMHPSDRPRDWWADWSSELTAAPGFAAPEPRTFRWRETYTTSSYLEVLRTHSDHIVLGEQRLGELMDAIGAVLDRHGGALPLDYVTELWIARAAGGRSGRSG
jgi:SAM-dependent methyltransferase